MPLSEHEQRQLKQIEQALLADYPKLANAARTASPRFHYKRRLIFAALGFVTGVALLLAGVATNYVAVSVAGFGIMVACSMWVITSYRRMSGVAAARGPARQDRASKHAATGLIERLEERWRRRQEGNH